MPVLRNILKMYVANKAQHSSVMAALATLGHRPGQVYSPLACEVCGQNAAGTEALVPTGKPVKVELGGGEYIVVTKFGNALSLVAGNSFNGGEATLWGYGPGGECGCSYGPNYQAHWS